MEDDKLKKQVHQSEKLVHALATRYGFRFNDFSLVWDDGEFQPARSEHELTIVSADGRRSAARIEHNALVGENPWRYIRHVDAALRALARRES